MAGRALFARITSRTPTYSSTNGGWANIFGRETAMETGRCLSAVPSFVGPCPVPRFAFAEGSGVIPFWALYARVPRR